MWLCFLTLLYQANRHDNRLYWTGRRTELTANAVPGPGKDRKALFVCRIHGVLKGQAGPGAGIDANVA